MNRKKMQMPTNIAAIIPAAGIGQRMGLKIPKQYFKIDGVSLLEHSLSVILSCKIIDKILVCLQSDDTYFNDLAISSHPKVLAVKEGGLTRARSVMNALYKLKEINDLNKTNNPWVLIHDAVRPCLQKEDLDHILKTTCNHGAILGIPVRDSLKRINKDSIQNSIDRTDRWHAFTPQIFPTKILTECLEKSLEELQDVTDESHAMEYCGYNPKIILGRSDNIKVTYPADLEMVKLLIQKEKIALRIGHGYDIHRFGSNKPLIIGGVFIPNHQGFIAHSDGDVLIHAVIDALFGAAGLGDIGTQFPNEPQYKDIDSMILLENAWSLVKKEGYKIHNIDITLIAQEPKIASCSSKMIRNLQSCLGNPPIQIKATTAEFLGSLGRKEGISCHAVALLQA